MVKMSGNACPKLLLMASCALAMGLSSRLSAESPAEKMLLAKAQSLVAHGHLDLAVQTWQQVLLSDPNDREALLGIAKADMQLGKTEEAQKYAQRLRDLGNSSADLAQIEAMPHVEPESVRLKEARNLARQGSYADAMKVYRELFPNGPPDGEMALEFYETQAAIPELRRPAIDHLHELAKQFSADPRYAIALGRILTYDPKTRTEGEGLLSHYDTSPEAQAALKQASGWDEDAKKAAVAGMAERATSKVARDPAADPMERSAYRALNSGQLDEAAQQFQTLLAKNPHNPRALTGMGYVSMKQGDFVQAVDYLQKARAAGATKLDGDISNARFWSRMAQAGTEQKSGDAQTAAKDYRDALSLKPTNKDAEEGLAGALLQAGNRADAVAILKREVGAKPDNEAAWRNLFLAQAEMSDSHEALATSQRMPRNVESRLETDPDYLHALIQVYQASGRKADADRTIDKALSLPFPNHGRDLPVDKQLQYAELLITVRRFEPALRLYRQVLAADPENAGAWRALVAAEHQFDRDDDAIAAVRGMPRSAYDQSLNDPGFLALLGSIYQSRNQLANAEKFLEKAISVSSSPQPGIELQLANVYIAQGEQQKAYSLYRRELDRNPRSPDAWRGLITTLHQSNRDREALRELDGMPESARLALEQDPSYLQTLASIETATGQDKAALQTFDLLSQAYLDQQVDEPADVQLQYGWLLLKAGDDRRLYSLVSQLAQTPGLTEQQQADFNKMWAYWSVRRASSALAGGDLRRAVAILEAAAQTFPGNVDICNSLAGAYLQAGQPKRAVTIYESLDLSHATLAQYHGAIGAALAARDMKAAELWLQAALDLYKDDAAILKMAAQFEQARGDAARAAAYYRAALDAMGPQPPPEIFNRPPSPNRDSADPGPGNTPARDLMKLLAPSGSTIQTTDESDRGTLRREAEVTWHDGPRAKVPTLGDFDSVGADDRDRTSSAALRDDVPAEVHRYSGRDSLRDEAPADGFRSQSSRSATSRQAVDYPSQENRTSQENWMDANNVPPARSHRYSVGDSLGDEADGFRSQGSRSATSRQAVDYPPQENPSSQEAWLDANDTPAQPHRHSVQDSLRDDAPDSFRSQGSRTAPSRQVADYPPQEKPSSQESWLGANDIPAQPHRYSVQASVREDESPDGGRSQGLLSAPPRQVVDYPPQESRSSRESRMDAYNIVPVNPSVGDLAAVEPPQEAMAPAPTPFRLVSLELPPKRAYVDAQDEQTSGPSSSGRKASSNWVPAEGPSESDAENLQNAVKNLKVPPRGGGRLPLDNSAPLGHYNSYSGQKDLGEHFSDLPISTGAGSNQIAQTTLPPLTGSALVQAPLTPREQIEQQLVMLEGANSNWIGGTSSLNYRSGQPGFDRLAIFSGQAEASGMFGPAARATVIVQPMLLDAGQATGTSTFRQGTLPLNAAPYIQSAAGTAGEFQLQTSLFGVRIGSTPRGFLVQNYTGGLYIHPPVSSFQPGVLARPDSGYATLICRVAR